MSAEALYVLVSSWKAWEHVKVCWREPACFFLTCCLQIFWVRDMGVYLSLTALSWDYCPSALLFKAYWVFPISPRDELHLFLQVLILVFLFSWESSWFWKDCCSDPINFSRGIECSCGCISCNVSAVSASIPLGQMKVIWIEDTNFIITLNRGRQCLLLKEPQSFLFWIWHS